MKLTIQKVLICALSLIFSIAACVCGMYMTILANMLMRYRILFCLFFILNPVLVIFMIRFMFKKPVPKEETDGAAESEKKKKWGFSKKDESVSDGTEAEHYSEPEAPVGSYSEGVYSEGTYSENAYDSSDNFAAASTENPDTSFPVSEVPEVTPDTSSFADEPDDISFGVSGSEKAVGSVTEDSVAKFKKISLKRKKRADE